VVAHPLVAKAKIGYLPENAPLYVDMTVVGFLRFCAELRGMSGGDCSRAVDKVMEMTMLETVKNQSIDTLSKGYRHRTCLAQSIVHDPEVLILDEPTDGLDPNQKHEVRGLIKRMGEEKAIIFSTHILEEVEAVCSRAVIIDRGKIVADGTPDELKSRSLKAGIVRVRIASGIPEPIDQELGKLGAAEKIETVSSSDGSFEAVVFPSGKAHKGELGEQVFELCTQKNWKLQELHEEKGRLDDMFRQITRPDTAA